MNYIMRITIVLFFSLLLTNYCFSQESFSITEVDKKIQIDGILEDAWFQADSISNFIQLEPFIGKASSRKTVVRALQFKDILYFSFVCYVEDKNEIVARIHRRDQLDTSDDIIAILLDTYQDNRTAVMFQVNALGTLYDSKINDDGISNDALWDTEWEVKTSISDHYWIVEFRIPIKSIQYKPNSKNWGCNFGRVIRVNQEIAWWKPVTENLRVSQNGILTNINLANTSKHQLDIFPYGTARYEDSDISGIHDKFKVDAGVDLQYKYSSNFKANISVNPDFATVEGDKEEINLTPWEIKFPEKRLFFQDGNEMFRTRVQTFYSRRIGDMLYGGKMIGKVGKYQFNGLFAQTSENKDASLPSATHTAFRVKRDILKSSTLGFTYTDKVTDTLTFRTFSMDYVMNLGKTWKLTGQFVLSTPGDVKSHSAWFVRFATENNIYHYHIRYTNIGKNFQDNVNQTGFIRDDDRHELDSDINYKFWFTNALQYIKLSGRNNIYCSQEGTLSSWYLTYGGRIYLKNRFSLDVNYNNEYKLFEKQYHNNYVQFLGAYNSDEASNVRMSYRFGRNYDRDFSLIDFRAHFQLFKKLTIDYELHHLTYTPDLSRQSTTLNILGLGYYFSKDLWVRIFMQHNSQSDRFYLYGLFGWRFKPPFGALYLIFNSDNYHDFDINNQMNHVKSQIAFLKLSFPISVF